MGWVVKYPQYEAVTEDGWSEWIVPVLDGYQMSCCDCGLVHTIQFKAADDGYPMFRVKRNNRATGQMRRYHHNKDSDAVVRFIRD